MKKSYHSMVVSIALATATRRDSDVGPALNVMYYRGAYHATSGPVSLVNPMRNTLLGLLIAVVLALSASGASVFGIAVWKIALAAAGAAMFVMAGGK